MKPRIVYILIDINISGGVAVVLQHANRLKKRGYDVAIVNLNTRIEPKINWFKCNVPIYNWDPNREDFPVKKVNIAIATHFSTAAIVKEKVEAKRKIYFVQSDERRFDLDAQEYVDCQNSYQLKMEFMTEAKWIQRWLKQEFGHNAYYVPNGLDEKIFFPAQPIEKKGKKPRVLLEGPIDWSFKGMDDAYKAAKDLNCELWIISSFGKPKQGWRCDRFFEKVPMHKMRSIYSACDIFLKMSKVEGFFGPPLEAMACRCVPVVSDCTGHDEYIEHEKNALVVKIGDVKAAKKAVQLLMDNQAVRKKLMKNGIATAKEWSWERSVDFLEKALRKEPVEIFYDENQPKVYDYFQVMYDCKSEIIFRSAQKQAGQAIVIDSKMREIKEKIEEIQDKVKEIENWKCLSAKQEEQIKFIQSSKFWRAREKYEKLKNVLKNKK